MINFNRVLSLQCIAAVSASPSQKFVRDGHPARMLEWLLEKGGAFHPDLEIRVADPDDPKSSFAIFATNDIAEDELLIDVPLSMRIDEGEDGEDECDTIKALAWELHLGEESTYAPYVNYLLDTQSNRGITSQWSEAGKDLLEKILNGDVMKHLDYDNDDIILFPPNRATTMVNDYVDDCEVTGDPMLEFATIQLIQRGWDEVLLPVYDMIAHRNGKWLNTKTADGSSIFDEEPVIVVAKRDIKAGEQLYASYNMCKDCGGQEQEYGTPELFRDYGFIEKFPQQWIFHDMEIGFRLDLEESQGDSDNGRVFLTEWVFDDDEGHIPDEKEMGLIWSALYQLSRTQDTLLAERDEAVPEGEWNLIVAFVTSMMNALEVAAVWEEDAYETDMRARACLQDVTEISCGDNFGPAESNVTEI